MALRGTHRTRDISFDLNFKGKPEFGHFFSIGNAIFKDCLKKVFPERLNLD